MNTPSHIVAPIAKSHTHTVIFLHGKGSDATEFAKEFFESQASDNRTFTEIFPSFKWVFPQSKIRMSTRFDSEESQWFDIWAVENPLEKEETQKIRLLESIEDILDVIRHEMSIVSPERLFIAGISQGCAVAIYALLCGNIKLGGFIGLSSWLPFPQIIQNISHDVTCVQSMSTVLKHSGPGLQPLNRLSGTKIISQSSVHDTPILLTHCKDDQVVPIANGRELRDALAAIPSGSVITWKEYEDGGHWINEPRGVDDIVHFIQGVMMTDKDDVQNSVE